MLVSWWVDLLRSGVLGAAFALWLAATVLPLAALALITSFDCGRVAVRWATATFGLDRMPNLRLKSRLEESA